VNRLAVLLVVAACSSGSHDKTVRVAAASDLAHAFDEIERAFLAKTGIRAQIDYGSSGLLAKQIENGAPYFLFAAANRAYVDQVVARGRCDGATAQLYSHGKLVVWTKGAAPRQLADLAEPRFARVAIADPDQAPYGAAAKQALVAAGLWDKLGSRIITADSVQGAMTYAQKNQADAALVSLSLAVVTDGGAYLKVDPALYAPLDQTLVVCGNGVESDAARRLAQFVMSPEGNEIMSRYGFGLK
jgi:molybdate transport system substrate-binding protein